MGAAKYGDLDSVQELIDSKSNLDVQVSSDQNSALHLAILSGNSDVAEALIRSGANVNIQNKYGQTPLHAAVNQGNLHLTQYLIEKGANPNIQDIHGISPLHYSHNKDMTLDLIRAGADVNTQDTTGFTPLHEAIVRGDKDTLIVLLEAGANINTQDTYKYTPLQLAILLQKKDIALALINIEDINLELKDSQGRTPEDLAASNESSIILDALRERKTHIQNNMVKNLKTPAIQDIFFKIFPISEDGL